MMMKASAGGPRPYIAIGSSKRKRSTVQTLGPHTYALPDVAPRPPSPRTPHHRLFSVLLKTIRLPLSMVMIPSMAFIMSILPRSLKHKLLGKLIPSIMERHVAKHTLNQRKLLLQHVQGRVLDVGSGGGAYLRHLGVGNNNNNEMTMMMKKKKASHVVCLEPVTALHDTIRKAATQAGFVQESEVTIVGEDLETYEPPPTSLLLFDWILLGNVLCEVPDQRQALEKVDRMLKPGGYVYFCEHVCSPPGTWQRTIQHVVSPFWRHASGGCNCNRDTLDMLESMGDRWDLISWEMTHFHGPFESPVYMGLARKATIDDA